MSLYSDIVKSTLWRELGRECNLAVPKYQWFAMLFEQSVEVNIVMNKMIEMKGVYCRGRWLRHGNGYLGQIHLSIEASVTTVWPHRVSLPLFSRHGFMQWNSSSPTVRSVKEALWQIKIFRSPLSIVEMNITQKIPALDKFDLDPCGGPHKL